MVTSVSSTASPLIPTIPGITGVLGSISATAAYANLTAVGQTKELTKVASAPQVATETAYFKSAIQNMKTVQDLINDPRALKYLMTAYGLGANTSQLGIVKQVLTQDPTNKNSLVNQLSATQWKTMATDLQTFATGLNTLKGDITSQTFDVQAITGQYLQVQQQGTTTYGSGGDAVTLDTTQNLYTNSLSGLTVNNGMLQTAEGYNVMGMKLDNQGNVQPPLGSTLLNSTDTVPNSDGTQTTVNESFQNQGNGNWLWTVKDTSGNILSQQTLAMTLNADGTIQTVNGSSNPSQNVNLTWTTGSGTATTSQSFDLSKVFTAGSNQYQTGADLRAVQLNWFANQNTPTSSLTPYVALNGSQAAASSSSFSNVESVQSNDTSNGGTPTYAAVTQSLTKNSDGTWNWNVTNSDGTVVYSQDNLNLAFDSNGILTSVNGNSNTAPSVTLNWGNGTTTSQSFDLRSLTNQSDFTQNLKVTDNIGVGRNISLQYKKIDDATNTWQVQVWNADSNKIASTLDVRFNTNGTVQSVGTLNSQTGEITDASGNPLATSGNVSIDWGTGYGSSTISLDLSNVTDLSSINTQTRDTATDSVALGAYQSASISQDGTVSATYKKADGSGTVSLDLYRLATNQFDNAGALLQSNGSNYLSASGSSGTDTLQPLGSDEDSKGNILHNESGPLANAPTITNAKNAMDTITSGYDNYVYQEALGQENQALRYAVYFKQNASNITSIDQLLGDGPSRDLISTVFGIPQEVANQDLTQQEQIFSSKVDVTKFKSSTYVDTLIQRFLAVSDANSGGVGNTTTSPLVSLLGGSGSTDSVTAAGNLLNTVTSNIKLLA